MSEHCYRVGIHGPPDPVKHPWVMVKFDGSWWRLIHVQDVPGRHWADGEVWFPVEAPPSELAPEPEGVEVSGFRYRINADGYLQKHTQFGWVLSEYREVLADELAYLARIAAALGLVDQPPVPRALIDWLERCDVTLTPAHVLRRIKAGEFGPVEPSVEWVTDRVPNDDEYPVLWGKEGHMRTAPRRDRDWYLAKGWRWVSLSVLLDAAGLGER